MRRVRFITPNAAPLPNDVYQDSAMPIEYALAKRRDEHVQSRSGAFVFHAQDQQNFLILITVLEQIRINGQLAAPRDEQQVQQRQQMIASPVYQSMIQQGLVAADGSDAGNFQRTLQTNPDIEILCGTGGGHHAVFSMNVQGAAYIDSKGAACPNGLLDRDNPNSTFQNFLRDRWSLIYGKPGDATARNRLAQRSVHFHQDVKQQEKDHESTDWCLTNLRTLGGNTGADANALKAGRKADRIALVAAINAGLPDPRNPGNVFPPLTYHAESQSEQQKQERQDQMQLAQQFIADHHQYAERTLGAAPPARPGHTVHLWRDASDAFRQNNTWIEIAIETPPTYNATDDINQFNATHDNGMTTDFKLNGSDEIVMESKGGEVDYQARFESLARDLAPLILTGPGAGTYNLPVVINSIKPPSQQEACKAAFVKFYGAGNVIVREVENNAIPDAGIRAQPPRH